MSAKASRQSSARSNLMYHYIGAVYEVYGVRPYVHDKYVNMFHTMEDTLQELGYGCADYAFTVARFLVKFTHEKGWKYPYVPVFLGKWALKRYIAVKDAITVDLEEDDTDELEHSELLVARAFIERNISNDMYYVSMRNVVKELRPLLSKKWLEIYETRGKRPYIMEELLEEYGVRNANTYLDIVDALG